MRLGEPKVEPAANAAKSSSHLETENPGPGPRDDEFFKWGPRAGSPVPFSEIGPENRVQLFLFACFTFWRANLSENFIGRKTVIG